MCKPKLTNERVVTLANSTFNNIIATCGLESGADVLRLAYEKAVAAMEYRKSIENSRRPPNENNSPHTREICACR
jgi:hypothetical protein